MEEIKKEEVYTPLVATPRKGISQAVKYGNILFVSGQVGEDLEEHAPEGIEAQTELAIQNMIHVLEAAGSSLDKVLMCRVFIQNMDDFAGMNKVYSKYFGDQDVGPARYTVVASPVAENLLVEIAAYAAV